MASFGVMGILMMLMSGGTSELLDFVSADAYWKSKGVNAVTVDMLMLQLKSEEGADITALVKQLGAGTFADREQAAQRILKVGPAALPQLERAADDPDAEISSRAKALTQQIQLNSKAAGVRKLMAIRTLGEMKKAEAVPALKGLLNSKEMFVAEYAARAIGEIEGKPHLRPSIVEAMKGDANLLPGNAGFVGQASIGGGNRVDLAATINGMSMIPPDQRAKTLDEANTHILQIVDQVGNVRIDAITWGLADNVGDREGYFVAVGRGKFDAVAAGAAIAKAMPNIKVSAHEGFQVYSPDEHAAFFFPSDELVVFMAGPSADKLPIKEMAQAAKTGKGEIVNNKEMSKLITAADRTGRMWAVANIGPAYKQAPIIGAFDSISLVGKEKGKLVDIEIKGTGSDPAKVKDAVDQVNKGLNEARNELPKMAQMMPMMKPFVDAVNSAKVESEGGSAKLSGQVEGDPASLMMVPMFFGGMHRAEAVEVQNAPNIEVKPDQAEPARKP